MGPFHNDSYNAFLPGYFNKNETLSSPKIMQISCTVCCLSCSFLLPASITEYIESEVNGKEILKLLTSLKMVRFWKSVKKLR